MRDLLIRLFYLGPLMGATLLLAGCNQGPAPGAGAKKPEVIIEVPVRRDVTDFEDFTGRTDAVKAVDIKARATGYLEKVLFTDGVMVKVGDPLFEIDRRPYKAELTRAEFTLAQNQARLRRLEADLQRYASLRPLTAASREELDKVKGDRDEAEAAVGVAKANLETARINIGFTEVRAPISGQVSRRYIDPGNMVKADDTLLTNIVSLDPIYGYFDVDERTFIRIQRLIHEGKVQSVQKKKAPFALALADEDGFPHKGLIDFLDNKVDPGTGTIRLRGTIENPNRGTEENPKFLLTPGLFIRVRLLVGNPHSALLVSERALGTDQGLKFIYVLNDKNEVIRRTVTIGAVHDGLRVIEEGLKDGERVIVSGLQRVRPGMEVDPKPAKK
jgi:RND family efflux transporter MFP subunit